MSGRWERRLLHLRSNLGHRLILSLALAVVVTAVAVSAVTSILGSRDARDRVVGQLKSVAALKQQEIATWESNVDLNLDIVLSSPSIVADLGTVSRPSAVDAATVRDSYNRVQQVFQWAAHRVALFDELFFMDTSGRVAVSTTISHEGQVQALSTYFTQGLKASHLEQPSYSLSLGKMTIVASAPVKDDTGAVIGVLAGRADLQGLNQIMIERPGLGETGETYLVGSNFRLLTYLRRDGYTIPETYIRTEGTQAAIAKRQSGSATYETYSGDKVIGVYVWLPGLQTALVAEQEEAEALASTRRAVWIIAGVAFAACIVAIFAGVGLTRRIVRPLTQLSETAGRIADGELDLRAAVTTNDEIGTLARSFNRMTGRLGLLVSNLQRRNERLKAIDETGQQISSILELDELLPYVARSMVETFGYEMVRMFHSSECCAGRMVICARGTCTAPFEVDLTSEGLPVAGSPAARLAGALDVIATAARTEQPVIPGAGGLELAMPIKIGDRLAGVLDIVASESRPLDEEDVLAARTLADQLAIAIENSRLYEQASELAAGQERQRLARDLHDAVSQTLFSVSLIAEVLPRIYARDPEQGAARLEELRQLTRGALAEMRTLLLELRPAALAEAKLPDLLKQLGEAVTGRARIPVEVSVEGPPELPTEVRLAFYRIAQEALNNVAKHSSAGKARVTLSPVPEAPRATRLTIEDDGAGFDPAGAGKGQLGLGIMKERADAVQAHVVIRSAPGEGTTVTTTWAPS